jgi:hypothetical protein
MLGVGVGGVVEAVVTGQAQALTQVRKSRMPQELP